MRICNIVSPIIVLLYTQIEVDLEGPPDEHIWPEVMGIILSVNAWMLPFLRTFGVEKGNGLSPFAIIIDSPHALGKLVKEYFKIPTPDRQGCITGMVDEDYRAGEEADDDVPSVGSGAYNTSGVIEFFPGRSRSLRWTHI